MELTGKGAARVRCAVGRGARGRSRRDGAAAAGRPRPRSGSLLPSALPQRTFLSREAGVSPSPFSRTPGTIKEP